MKVILDRNQGLLVRVKDAIATQLVLLDAARFVHRSKTAWKRLARSVKRRRPDPGLTFLDGSERARKEGITFL